MLCHGDISRINDQYERLKIKLITDCASRYGDPEAASYLARIKQAKYDGNYKELERIIDDYWGDDDY